MKHAALLLALLLGTPAWAGLQINSNDVRLNVDSDDVDDWKERYEDDCATVEHRNVTLSSEGCSDKKNKNKSNSSVHGDNNPGKGHDKHNHKNHDDDDYNIKIEHHDSDLRVEHHNTSQVKVKGKKNK